MSRGHLPRVPALCRRKDGRLYATDPHLKKQVYFKNPEAYERWRADFLERIKEIMPSPEPMTLKPGARVTVAKLAEAYLDHAERWYVKDGSQTSEVNVICQMLRRLEAVAGDKLADRLRVADVEAFLERCIAEDLSRRTINALLRKLRTMARWAVRKEVLSGETLGRILSVPALPKGRTAAREKPKVKPVPLEVVQACLPCLPDVYRALVELQLLTGMRPGEVLRLRSAEIDRSGTPWIYVPERYKTEHRHEEDDARRRRVYFGPRSRALLEPYLRAARFEDEPVFRTRKGRAVTIHGYHYAIRRASTKAGVPRWFPNQLRHATGTLVRERYGAEAASNYLGHESLKTTEIYAERSAAQARTIAEEMG